MQQAARPQRRSIVPSIRTSRTFAGNWARITFSRCTALATGSSRHEAESTLAPSRTAAVCSPDGMRVRRADRSGDDRHQHAGADVLPRDDMRLEQLFEETQHLTRLVEDLRTLANAEAGALDLRKELVDPEELIRDAAGSFDRTIEVHVPDELPSIDVDPVRIREILLNLLSNAIRHTPPDRTVAIQAEMRP